MKAKWAVLAVVALVLAAFAPPAKAQPFGTVSWGSGQPQAGAGSISGSGTYTTVNGNWTPLSATMQAVPMGGGLIGFGNQTVAFGNGTWGPITVNNLAVG